ncbi:MAG: hypothetical protein AUJ21_00020 [Anaerolineae bacterium CG1_02_58_13]|nr:MAG: hypothetical protein AUJ21_00020 [Anaerolineae bacterium CG1_02_58_13]
MEQIRLLSRREKEVVTLLLQGKSNKQIALSLGVSERTVEFHLKNIYAKLQVNSRVELILQLGKATGDITEKPVESTVDIVVKNVHNGNQPATQSRSAQSLKNTISTIKKELAMTKTIVLEDVGTFLRKHPIFFSLLVFLAVSLIAHYLIVDFGLYFWLSYILLGLLLGAGSIYFGLSWSKVTAGKIYFRPLVIASILMLFVLVPVIDLILLNTIAKNAGQVSLTLGHISNKAMWLVGLDGKPYLYSVYREGHIFDDMFWLYVPFLYMVLLFLIGVFSSKRLNRKKLASA